MRRVGQEPIRYVDRRSGQVSQALSELEARGRSQEALNQKSRCAAIAERLTTAD